MHWTHARFNDLSVGEHTLLQLRSRVFVLEQHCIFLDLDGIDLQPNVYHILGKNDANVLLAYARLSLPASTGEALTISRVVTAPEWRGSGSGHALMDEILRLCRKYCPGEMVTLSAQTHLCGFYTRHGFTAQGAPYLEDGIEHIRMDCDLASSN